MTDPLTFNVPVIFGALFVFGLGVLYLVTRAMPPNKKTDKHSVIVTKCPNCGKHIGCEVEFFSL